MGNHYPGIQRRPSIKNHEIIFSVEEINNFRPPFSIGLVKNDAGFWMKFEEDFYDINYPKSGYKLKKIYYL